MQKLCSCSHRLSSTPVFVTPSLADEPIKVTGCVAAGVEAKCLVLRTVTGKTYDITAAKPARRPVPTATSTAPLNLKA